MGVTAEIFLASISLKEMRYLVYIRYLWYQPTCPLHSFYFHGLFHMCVDQIFIAYLAAIMAGILQPPFYKDDRLK
jgi:hypothetical protein